ncbi:MAG: hypothetical protein MZU95_00215 [Desulfomicrobium escambiense]|nr:hypothetical protein [Desulfomicrobium escambiense]
MLEASGLMVFYENMLALNNVEHPLRDEPDRRGVRRQQRRQVHPDVRALRDHARHPQEGGDGRRRAHHAGRQHPLRRAQEITDLKPSRAGTAWASCCAPNGAGFSRRARVLENLKIGGYLATAAQAGETLDYRLHAVSRSEQAQKQGRRVPERRRAADAGHRPGADGAAEDPAAGRAAAGPEPADAGHAHARHAGDPGREEDRHHHHRAVRAAGASRSWTTPSSWKTARPSWRARGRS